MKKSLYILFGLLAVTLGVIGIFVPGLPTTPFLLLGSWLFYKSSDRLHAWLHRSRLGEYIRRYESKEGVPVGSKIFSLSCMWAMIALSAFVFFRHWHVRALLLVLGACGTYCILFLVPTKGKPKVG